MIEPQQFKFVTEQYSIRCNLNQTGIQFQLNLTNCHQFFWNATFCLDSLPYEIKVIFKSINKLYDYLKASPQERLTATGGVIQIHAVVVEEKMVYELPLEKVISNPTEKYKLMCKELHEENDNLKTQLADIKAELQNEREASQNLREQLEKTAKKLKEVNMELLVLSTPEEKVEEKEKEKLEMPMKSEIKDEERWDIKRLAAYAEQIGNKTLMKLTTCKKELKANRSLKLYKQGITQIGWVSCLHRLQELDLGRNLIKKIEGLDTLFCLEKLSLEKNELDVKAAMDLVRLPWWQLTFLSISFEGDEGQLHTAYQLITQHYNQWPSLELLHIWKQAKFSKETKNMLENYAIEKDFKLKCCSSLIGEIFS